MKVLHLLSSGNIGGIERLCLEFSRNVDEPWFYCFAFSGGPIYQQMKSEKPNFVICLKARRFSLYSKLKLLEFCKKNGIQVVIIHHISLYLNDIFIFLARHLKNVQFVRYLHESYDEKNTFSARLFFIRPFAERAMIKGFRYSSKVISVSSFVENCWKNFLNQKGYSSIVGGICWSTIYNGISSEFFPAGRQNQILNKKTILYIGRIEKVKGLKEMFDAVSLCHLRGFKLVLVGSGGELDFLKRYSRDLGIEVVFPGPTNDVKSYLSSASIFILPSTCQEAFGISLVEAMAYGLICISSDRGGLPEIVKNGDNGFLVNPCDTEKFASTISKILGLFSCENGLSELSAISQSAKFTARKFSVQHTIDNLQRVLSNH